MRFIFRHLVLSFVPFIFVFSAPANASVSLSFTNGGATPTSTSVNAGSSFPFQIKLTSSDAATADMVTAVDYYLLASTSGVFMITSRNTQTDGSVFGAPYESDSQVPLPANGPGLNPRTATNLGASTTNTNDPPISNATVIVADYTLSVAANAPTGVYTISTFSQPGTGYSDASFNNQTFASPGSYTVTVTPAPGPEPASAGLLAIAGIAGLCRRHRRAASLVGAV